MAEALSDRILQVVNGDAVTVDFAKLNPDIVEDIIKRQDEEFQQMLRTKPRRRPVTGMSMEQMEQVILASLPDDPDAVDCEPKAQQG